jgi:glutaryl-CoA dehydrogenase
MDQMQRGMGTRARQVDGGFCLVGSKTWITNNPIADLFIVWAKSDDGVIRGFILARGAPALSSPPLHGKIGLRTSVSGQIVMDDVFVPGANMLPGANGLNGPFTCLNSAHCGIAWEALGAAEACWQASRVDALSLGRGAQSLQCYYNYVTASVIA